MDLKGREDYPQEAFKDQEEQIFLPLKRLKNADLVVNAGMVANELHAKQTSSEKLYIYLCSKSKGTVIIGSLH